MNILFIILILSSCIYDKEKELKPEDGVYKLLLDKDFTDKFKEDKKIKRDMLVEDLKNLHNCLNKKIKEIFHFKIKEENYIELEEEKLEKENIELELKEDIKLLLNYLKKSILNIKREDNKDSDAKAIITGFNTIIENSYTRSYSKNFSRDMLLSRSLPIILFMLNIEDYMIINELNKETIYDAIMNGDTKKLKNEVLKSEKIIGYLEKVYICIKDRKVFVCFEDKEFLVAYVNKDNYILDVDDLFLNFSNIFSLNLKIIDSSIYLENIKVNLLKI